MPLDIDNNSRVLYYRKIRKGNKIAPFLSYDEDPYCLSEVFRIWDAYTTTDTLYSEPFNNVDNYIRNGKVVLTLTQARWISSATRTLVKHYTFRMFKNMEEMPDLSQHALSCDYFKIQAQMYASTIWRTHRYFITGKTRNLPMGDYADKHGTLYTIPLPGQNEPVCPDPTLARINNMIAWMAARSMGRITVSCWPIISETGIGLRSHAGRSTNQPDTTISQQLLVDQRVQM